MKEDLYIFLTDYIYDNKKSGYKLNKTKNSLTIYGTTSVGLWIFGVLILAWSVALFVAQSFVLGAAMLGIALFGFFFPLTKRTVFDFEKKEIRQEVFFIPSQKVLRKDVTGYHTTVVKINGRIKSYVFDLQFNNKNEFGTETTAMMKGIAGFKDYEDLQDFYPVVTRMLDELR